METIAGGKTPGLCLVEALPAEVVALGISICDTTRDGSRIVGKPYLTGLGKGSALFIKGADGQYLSIGKVESMQEPLIGGVSARTLEQRVHFYPSNPDLSLVSRLFHPVPSFVGVT